MRTYCTGSQVSRQQKTTEMKTSQRVKVPEDLHGGQYSCQYVSHTMTLNHRGQSDVQRPWEAQQHILHNGTVVIGLRTHGRSRFNDTVTHQRSHQGSCLPQQTPCVDRRSPLSETCSPQRYGRTDPSPSSGPRWGCSMSWRSGSWCVDRRKSLHRTGIHLGKTAKRTWFNQLTGPHIEHEPVSNVATLISRFFFCQSNFLTKSISILIFFDWHLL